MPPFDATRIPIELWVWPWTDWPYFDDAVFTRDLDRIERFYRARGFYAASIADIKGAAGDPAYTLERLVLTVTALRQAR